MGCASSTADDSFSRLSPVPLNEGRYSYNSVQNNKSARVQEPQDELKVVLSSSKADLGPCQPAQASAIDVFSLILGAGKPLPPIGSISGFLGARSVLGSRGLLTDEFSNLLRNSFSTSTVSATQSRGLGGNLQNIVVRAEDGTILSLRRVVGQGGFGRVYLGDWEGRDVAVKVLDAEDPAVPWMQKIVKECTDRERKMTEVEAVVLALVHHEHIVETLKIVCGTQSFGRSDTAIMEEKHNLLCGSDLEDEEVEGAAVTPSAATPQLSFYIVMEYAIHGSLYNGLKFGHFHCEVPESLGGGDNPDLVLWDAWAALETLKEVALGLRYLHSQGVIHGDLKAANALLFASTKDRRGFTTKLTDFGFSRIVPVERFSKTDVETSVSATVTHMPPELLSESRLTASTDVYSFGIVMWETYMGKSVHQNMKDSEVMAKVIKEGLRPEFPPDAPRRYVDLAKRCWSNDISVRPTAPQLLTILCAAQLELAPLGTQNPHVLISGASLPKARRVINSKFSCAGRSSRSAILSRQRYQRALVRDLMEPSSLSSWSNDSVNMRMVDAFRTSLDAMPSLSAIQRSTVSLEATPWHSPFL
eukprot:gene21158-28048_t